MAPSAMMPVSAPPPVVGPTSKRATRPTSKLPQDLIDAARVAKKEHFDANRHMNYQTPSKVYTMEEIGLAGQGISPIAVTAPFQLFTREAIMQMRAEIFSEPVLKDCQYMSDFVKNTIRGMGPARAPFTCDAWRSPEVLSAISEVAGIDLIPAMDCEIAAINISISGETTTIVKNDDELPAFAWHRDSYPFVCVTMLSDCTGMTGGETALKTASGEIMKVRGPAMGTAVVMQGRYIEHQALKAFGGRERISMVTSFRAKSPHVRDETVLTGVRPICDLSELYTQYTEYRLEILEERIRAKLQQERQRERANRPFEIVEMRNFLAEQARFLEAMTRELIE
ncbi:hypothetical protein PITC_042010 [Penicillium italicum]|uniref:Oxoglutarate/iron-dependent dioxygenase n=1 Tax=Penicillium italicum TaxID=40296 RepID=A0A0A2KAW7_PENIT|nr:hypothetical protein PITC_042010 [Penicillium italicum]